MGGSKSGDGARASQASLERLVRGSSVGFVVLDQAGLVRATNDALGQSIGGPLLLGEALGEHLAPPDRGAFSAHVARVCAGRSDRFVGRVLGRGGRLLGLSFHADPVALEDGERGYGAAVVPSAARLGADELEHFAALGRIAGAVSREIMGPLATLIANLSFSSSELQRASGVKKPGAPALEGVDLAGLRSALLDATDCATRARDVVLELQAFFRPELEGDGSTDLGSAVSAVVSLLRSEIHHRARLVLEIPEGVAVRATRRELAEILFLLMLTAATAIDEGNAEHNEVRLSATRQRDFVVIELSDSGAGLSAEDCARLFEPVAGGDVDRPTRDLSSVKRAVEWLGGSIVVDSVEGHGTTFRLRLPSAPSTSSAAPEVDAEPTRSASRHVLVLDDDPAFASAFRRALFEVHHVTIARTAADAMSRVRSGEDIDLVVVSLLLPQGTGMDFFEELCEERPALRDRVVFVTDGASTPRTRSFLQRISRAPLHKASLVAEIPRLLARRR